jgi:hypothetical protein
MPQFINALNVVNTPATTMVFLELAPMDAMSDENVSIAVPNAVKKEKESL